MEKKPRTYTADITVNLDTPDWPLLEWRKLINKLIREYGPEANMQAFAGYNNVDLDVTYQYRKENGVKKIIKSKA